MIWSPCNFASIADSRGDGLLVMSKRVGNFRHNLAAASQKIIMMRMTSGLASSPWCVAFSSISLGDLTQWTHCLLLLEKYISSPWTLWSEFQRNCSKLFKMFVCLIRGHVVVFCHISGRSNEMMPTATGKILQESLHTMSWISNKLFKMSVCLIQGTVLHRSICDVFWGLGARSYIIMI